MARTIVIDVFQLTGRAPPGLAACEYAMMCRSLNERRFQSGLRRALRFLIRKYPALNKVRVALSR